MENKEFFIRRDALNLHAKLDFPETEEDRFPLVIVVHGLTGHMEEPHIQAVAKAANDAGCASLRVELYGHGQSDGDFHDHNLLLWILDVIAVIDYAKKLDFVTDLYLAAHSQGGVAIILAAAVKASDIKAIMPLAPALVIKDAALKGDLFGTSFDPDRIPDEALLFGERPVSGNYYRINQLLPLDEAVKRYKGPVLLVHSDTDELVPYSCSRKLAGQYEKATLVTVPNDDHCYRAHLDMLKESVRKFLEDLEGERLQ